MPLGPIQIEIRKSEGVHVQWADETTFFYPCALLRRMSPSADSKEIREQLEKNPLTILPNTGNDITIEDGELVGNYAIRFAFSDGHRSGIYTWEYLRSLQH